MAEGNPIPTKSRLLLKQRDDGHCLMCGVNGTDLHHRRRRRVKDEEQHAPSNLVTLCRRDHQWVHANPREAQAKGLILPHNTEYPHLEPVTTFMGRVWLTTTGEYAYKIEETS